MVADTFSSTLGVLQMGTGNDNNTWGNNANTSIFQILEDAISNIFTSSATSGTVDLSGTPPPAGPSQARFWQLRFTGSLAGTLTCQVPNLSKEWIINNACTLNGFALQVKTPAGAAVTVPSGYMKVWCDGANNIFVSPYGSNQAQLSNGAMGAPSYSFAAEVNSGLYRSLTNDFRFSVAGNDIVSFTPSGINLFPGKSLLFNNVAIDPTGIAQPGFEQEFAGIFAPTGWYMEFGQAVSRTTDAPLFNAITVATTGNTHNNTTIDNLPVDLRGLGLEGAFVEITGASLGTTIISINSATSMTVSGLITGTATGAALRILPYGQGDGSTTFNIPDRRGYVTAGRDNMGGTAAGRLTLAQSQGILGTKLNATGGEQGHAQTSAEVGTHTHINTLTDPGHGHQMQKNGGAASNSIIVGDPTGNSPASGGLAQCTTATINVVNNTTGITINNVAAGSGTAANVIQPTGITNKIIKR